MTKFITLLFFILFFASGAEASSSLEHQAGGKISTHVHGPLGESYMDRHFESQGWEKVQGEVGRNGIDGLYVKRKNGSIRDVMVAESKFGSSQLQEACSAQQMTHAWTICKLNKRNDKIDKDIEKLQKSIDRGQVNNTEGRKNLQNLRAEQKDLKQIIRHVNHNNYRRRVFRTHVSDGKLHINISKVEGDFQSRIKEAPETSRTISLKNIPSKMTADRKIYNAYFEQLEAGLKNSGMDRNEAKQTVKNIKQAYKTGRVINSAGAGGQAEFLKQHLIASLNKKITNTSNWALRKSLVSKRAVLRTSDKMRKLVDPDWFMHERSLFMNANALHTARHGKSVLVKGILTQGGKLLVSIPKGIVTGSGAGLISFAFDAGSAVSEFYSGEVFQPEFERKVGDAALTGAIVGGGIGIAVMLGAGPTGWVVLGVGVAGYLITDIAVQRWHQVQDKKHLTSQDLMIFGIQAKDTAPLRVGIWNHNSTLHLGNWSN